MANECKCGCCSPPADEERDVRPEQLDADELSPELAERLAELDERLARLEQEAV